MSALAGALPRCMWIFGNYVTMDIAMTGRQMPVEEAERRGLVKEIVPLEKLLDRALDYAEEVASVSPEAVIISRLGVREAWETGVSRATRRGEELWADGMMRGDNAAEGLAAYREKRAPKWFPSKM